MSALDVFLRGRERRAEIAQEAIDALRAELGLQPELPWGLAPELRPATYDEAVEAGLIAERPR